MDSAKIIVFVRPQFCPPFPPLSPPNPCLPALSGSTCGCVEHPHIHMTASITRHHRILLLSVKNDEVHPIDRPPRLLGERLLHPTVGGRPPACLPSELPGGRGGGGPTARLLRLRRRVGSEQEQAQGRIADKVVRVARVRRRHRRRHRRIRARVRIRSSPPRSRVVDGGLRGEGPAEAHYRRRAREREGHTVRADQGQVRRRPPEHGRHAPRGRVGGDRRGDAGEGLHGLGEAGPRRGHNWGRE